MSREITKQRTFVVFLEMPLGGVRSLIVKATSSEVAGRRAMKRVKTAVKVHRVEKSM